MFNRHVSKALKALVKGVQANEEVDEEELEDMVWCLIVQNLECLIVFLQLVKAKEQQEKEYMEKAKADKAKASTPPSHLSSSAMFSNLATPFLTITGQGQSQS
jgi:double-strand break repair protein MRE11